MTPAFLAYYISFSDKCKGLYFLGIYDMMKAKTEVISMADFKQMYYEKRAQVLVKNLKSRRFEA